MKKILIVGISASLVLACQRSDTAGEHAHSHGPETAVVSYTLYSDKTELFVEFKPLVVGEVSSFATHVTALGDTFTALGEGSVTVSLIVSGKGIRQTSEAPDSPGIFRLALKPTTPGTGKLIFDIKARDYSDRITIEGVQVFESSDEAQLASRKSTGTGIAFLKEQAWKIDFANLEVKPQTFMDVIHTTGVLTARSSGEQIVSAQSNGMVNWNEQLVPGSRVEKGDRLFLLTSGNLAQGNIETQYREAEANFQKAKADYERVQPLVEEKIVSAKDFLEIKTRYEQAKIAYETLGRNYTSGGRSVSAPLSGFVKQILVRPGEFVQAGQPLAVITRDGSLQLRADVPVRYVNELPQISEAAFKTVHNNRVYQTGDLNGRVISYGKSIADGTALLPVFFSLSNDGTLIAGDVVEVYLKTQSIPDALVVPVTSLIEEQGTFYVYIQRGGESFEKRPVVLGASDAAQVQILTGIREGERVVTKGAQTIRLATQSGSLPAHGHEH